jgi:hypothetical protein
MSYLLGCSSTWHSGMVLCWRDRALEGPIDANNYEAAVEEVQVALATGERLQEAPQDSCIVEFRMPWHIGSSLCALA